MASLTVDSALKSGKKKKYHQRTATRFVDEANIAETDQLDLAEFIVAAHYLGVDADDTELMEAFFEMESQLTNSSQKPKEAIKQFISTVQSKTGIKDDDTLPARDDNKELDDTDHEIVGTSLASAINNEDAQWQEMQIDHVLSSAAQDQNLQIARKLLADTALTAEDVAQITGVDRNLLAEYEEEEEEYETDDEEIEEDTQDATQNDEQKDNDTNAADISKADAIVIQASDMGKSMALTNGDLNALDELIKGGTSVVADRSEEVINLLKKMQQAVKLSPGGAKTILKVQRTMRIVLDEHKDSTEAPKDEPAPKDEAPKDEAPPKEEPPKDEAPKEDTNKGGGLAVPKSGHINKQSSEYVLKPGYDIQGVKLPQKFRVVIHPGALVKESIDIRSDEVAKIPIGTVVIVEEIDGRRARISSPVVGWVSLHAKDSRVILQKENTSSKEMEQAVHAQRARQTKILILKSITTLNDATVTRILEKSDWNLRRAIEAFYMAKYKTQQFMEKKEEIEAQKKSQTTNKDEAPANDNAPTTPEKKPKQRRSIVQGWWGSWKTFSKQNR